MVRQLTRAAAARYGCRDCTGCGAAARRRSARPCSLSAGRGPQQTPDNKPRRDRAENEPCGLPPGKLLGICHELVPVPVSHGIRKFLDPIRCHLEIAGHDSVLRPIEWLRSASERLGHTGHSLRDLIFLLLEQRFGGRSGRVEEFGDDTAVVAPLWCRVGPSGRPARGHHARGGIIPICHGVLLREKPQSAILVRQRICSTSGSGRMQEFAPDRLSNRCHSLPDNRETPARAWGDRVLRCDTITASADG